MKTKKVPNKNLTAEQHYQQKRHNTIKTIATISTGVVGVGAGIGAGYGI
jgi:hypothetical protein